VAQASPRGAILPEPLRTRGLHETSMTLDPRQKGDQAQSVGGNAPKFAQISNLRASTGCAPDSGVTNGYLARGHPRAS
jgi:hypothetical protein